MFCIGSVDTPYHGLRHPFKRLGAESAPHEIGDRFVCIAAARDERLKSHPKFTAPTENGTLEERAQRAGCHHVKAFRDRVQSSLLRDEAAAHCRIRADTFIGDAELFAQCLCPRFGGDKGIGAMLYQETGAMGGVDDTAKPVARFKQRDMERDAPFLCLARQTITGGEACDSAADDDGAFGVLVHDDTVVTDGYRNPSLQIFSQASSANMLMNFGWVPTVPARINAMPHSAAVAAASISRS